MVTDRVVAIAADYADALLVVRRAKRLLLLLLMLALLAQLAIFAVAHFTDMLKPNPGAPVTVAEMTSTTAPATNAVVNTAALADRAASAASSPRTRDVLTYLTFVTLSMGVVFSILLSLVLFITVQIMLVGRLIGVAYVTRAFVLSLLLAILLFPWQSILATAGLETRDFVLPGVLYTWDEINSRVPMRAATDLAATILYWGRFVALPLVALIVLLLVQVRSGRGLKLALGEEELLSGPHHDEVVVTSHVR